jgi:hypothetical protein
MRRYDALRRRDTTHIHIWFDSLVQSRRAFDTTPMARIGATGRPAEHLKQAVPIVGEIHWASTSGEAEKGICRR